MKKNLSIKSLCSSKHIEENQNNSLKNQVKTGYKASFNANPPRLSLLVGIVLLSVILFLFGGCSREESKEDMSLVNGKLEQLEKKIAQLEAQFSETNESVTTLGSYVTYLEERIEKLNKESEKASHPKEPPSRKNEQYHKVVRGDTLYSISKKYGLSVDEIRRLNNLSDSKPIQPGQKLMVTTGNTE
jgi:LysM repeat protein